MNRQQGIQKVNSTRQQGRKIRKPMPLLNGSAVYAAKSFSVKEKPSTARPAESISKESRRQDMTQSIGRRSKESLYRRWKNEVP